MLFISTAGHKRKCKYVSRNKGYCEAQHAPWVFSALIHVWVQSSIRTCLFPMWGKEQPGGLKTLKEFTKIYVQKTPWSDSQSTWRWTRHVVFRPSAGNLIIRSSTFDMFACLGISPRDTQWKFSCLELWKNCHIIGNIMMHNVSLIFKATMHVRVQ